MRLSKDDKEYLKGNGYSEKDFPQIERATTVTDYEYKGKKIGIRKAINLLGRETFLSGISRSAFHWTACRETSKGELVYFNSTRRKERGGGNGAD